MTLSKLKTYLSAAYKTTILFAIYLFFGKTAEPADPRPSDWAEAIESEEIPNFYKVTATLYRGAQPTAEGIRQLKAMGIKTIVSFRSLHRDDDEIGDTKIRYEHIGFDTWKVEHEAIIKFLKIIQDEAKKPVFVHCQHGADRTGAACAVYRMVVCGWAKEKAMDEMVRGGFGFHPIWKNIIRYIEQFEL